MVIALMFMALFLFFWISLNPFVDLTGAAVLDPSAGNSNRLNQIVKVLTVMSTIFLPLTVLTSLYGMNVRLPHLPGGDEAQFWWIVAMMTGIAGAMLAFFRRKRWI